MFLSKVSLVRGGSGNLSLLRMQRRGVYAIHQMLWQLFTNDEQRLFLFRQESTPQKALFYVLSQNAPAHHPEFVVQSKAFLPKLHSGQKLAFNLRANPTVSIEGKRHDVLMHAKQQARAQGQPEEHAWNTMERAAQNWLCSKPRLLKWGVSLDMLPVVDSYVQHRSRKKSGQDISFSSVDYQGVLTVIDVERFWQQYCQGFGRAKALGCGLMLIRYA